MSMNEDFMIDIRLKEAISALHRLYLNVSIYAQYCIVYTPTPVTFHSSV